MTRCRERGECHVTRPAMNHQGQAKQYMNKEFTTVPQPIPAWIWAPVSLAILAHLTAIITWPLSAGSGPWPGPENGSFRAPPPDFAQKIGVNLTAPYLNAIKMTHDYHFSSNVPGGPVATFEVRLKDERGQAITTVTIPEKNTNAWVRHRQSLLAQGLAEDVPVVPPSGENIPAPNQAVKMVKILDSKDPHLLTIKEVEEHLIPRGQPVFAPSDWSMLLARSYVRHLCREHGAASGELIRHSRMPATPGVLAPNAPREDDSEEVLTIFGEFSR